MQAEDGSAVSGVVKETSKAKKDFDTAISQNKWAGFLTEASSDVFVISIGAIPPEQDVKVYITYVTELSDDELLNEVRFSLPTYIADRYGTPPSQTNSPSSSSTSATFNITADVQMNSQIKDIASPSHFIKVAPTQKGSTMYSSTVTLDPAYPAFLDKEFILSIIATSLDAPRCVAEVLPAKNSVAISLTLVPHFGLPPIPSQEYVFLIDRSGSMDTTYRIDYAKKALIVLLKSLPANDTYFNIISFGSGHSSLWSSSQKYTRTSLATATSHVDSMTANMGGTEIGAALNGAINSRVKTLPTSFFVLTDGEVWNTDAIISSVRTAVSSSGDPSSGRYVRFFTLGVGDAASTALCEGVARAGNGICLMTTQSEDIAGKCSRLLAASRVPPLGSMGDLRIDWGYTATKKSSANEVKDESQQVANIQGPISLFDADFDPLAPAKDTGFQFTLGPPPSIQQAPSNVPNLYPGNRFLVSAILSDTVYVPNTVTLSGKTPSGQALGPLPVPVQKTMLKPRTPPLIHTLAAHRLIQELEDGNITSQGVDDENDKDLHDQIAKAAIVHLSEKYQLASKYASFIAVDKSSDTPSSDKDSFGDDGHHLRGGALTAASFQHAYKPQPSQFAGLRAMAIPILRQNVAAPSASAAQPPRKTERALLVSADDPVTAVARLQSFDGSFQLDAALCSLLSASNVSLQKLKNSIPSSIRSSPQAEIVWATVLAAAYLKVKLADEKDIWGGLWDKAKYYVTHVLSGGVIMFERLVMDAAKLL
ncbi:hypothetical protein AcW1_008870 [Taiwanofungus camphoratus]|nr:hypothetical protein AcV7_007126 [Antrodia cinnamomea]KAI0949182.1 hypothetical protein AcW1_008870 [Antrodia cinnamomea]